MKISSKFLSDETCGRLESLCKCCVLLGRVLFLHSKLEKAVEDENLKPNKRHPYAAGNPFQTMMNIAQNIRQPAQVLARQPLFKT